MLKHGTTLVFYRNDLRNVYNKVLLESVHLDMFEPPAQGPIREAHFVTFQDGGKEILLKNRYGATGIITNLGETNK
jgi:hypothetical protein